MLSFSLSSSKKKTRSRAFLTKPVWFSHEESGTDLNDRCSSDACNTLVVPRIYFLMFCFSHFKKLTNVRNRQHISAATPYLVLDV